MLLEPYGTSCVEMPILRKRELYDVAAAIWVSLLLSAAFFGTTMFWIVKDLNTLHKAIPKPLNQVSYKLHCFIHQIFIT